MNYAVGKDWRLFFDIVVTKAGKEAYFTPYASSPFMVGWQRVLEYIQYVIYIYNDLSLNNIYK